MTSLAIRRSRSRRAAAAPFCTGYRCCLCPHEQTRKQLSRSTDRKQCRPIPRRAPSPSIWTGSPALCQGRRRTMGASPKRRSASEMAVVRLENIAKSYAAGTAILKNLSLVLEPGGFYFVTGASGAGKTTLLKLICLAEAPSSGVVTLFETDTAGLSRGARAGLRRRIGIVFQDFRLIDELSVAENVALPLRVAGAPEAEIREHLAALLQWLGLAEQSESLPTALSSGEKQRVAIARALVARPDLLIADEPTGHVDQETASLLV